MVQIIITGERNSGKTATAIAIARLLNGKGQNVRYIGHSREQEQLIADLIFDGDDPPFTDRRQIQIVDRT